MLLLEDITVAHLVFDLENTLSFLEELLIGPYSKQLNQVHMFIHYLRSILILFSPTHRTPKQYFPSDFPTSMLYEILMSLMRSNAPSISSSSISSP